MSTRILILGVTGMLGHKLAQVLGTEHDTHMTVRRADTSGLDGILDTRRVLTGVSAEDLASVEAAVDSVDPDVVVNCIGIVKQADEARQAIPSITVNALFPHRLAALCGPRGARLIHISTDCVFSGRDGDYAEATNPDPVDLYGRSKLLGEVDHPGCLTLRTSIVGRELAGSHGLLEWFLGASGSVRGFERAVFSGLTTQALSRVIAALISDQPGLSGLRHVAAAPINKLDLLNLFKQAYGLDVEVVPDRSLVIDRSLNGGRFEKETGIQVGSWAEMVDDLAADQTPYERLRNVIGTC